MAHLALQFRQAVPLTIESRFVFVHFILTGRRILFHPTSHVHIFLSRSLVVEVAPRLVLHKLHAFVLVFLALIGTLVNLLHSKAAWMATAPKLFGISHRGSQWVANIKLGGKKLCLGCRNTAEEAARLFDRAAYKLRGPEAQLNFNLTDEQKAELDAKSELQFRASLAKENLLLKLGRGSSRFIGVSWNKENQKWQARIQKGGVCLYYASFLTEEEAAQAYDAAVIERYGPDATTNAKLFSGDFSSVVPVGSARPQVARATGSGRAEAQGGGEGAGVERKTRGGRGGSARRRKAGAARVGDWDGPL
ncbi:unnamed protein product [Closterium sp. Yama58-4]|nr:unnamed protein product [Closterium sp. Yama58-4]